ncbi:MAG: hypothetical protein WA188_20200 [Terriglobales bacterium]
MTFSTRLTFHDGEDERLAVLLWPPKTVHQWDKSLADAGNDKGDEPKQLEVAQRAVDKGDATDELLLSDGGRFGEEEEVAQQGLHEEPQEGPSEELLIGRELRDLDSLQSSLHSALVDCFITATRFSPRGHSPCRPYTSELSHAGEGVSTPASPYSTARVPSPAAPSTSRAVWSSRSHPRASSSDWNGVVLLTLTSGMLVTLTGTAALVIVALTVGGFVT